MALVAIAHYSDLRQGQVAASLLRACGIPHHLQGEHHGGVDFLMWRALDGFRLLVPASELETAAALLQPQAYEREPDEPEPGRVGAAPRIAAGLVSPFLGVEAGFLAMTLARDGAGAWRDKLWGVAWAGVALALAVVASRILFGLAHPP